MALIDMHTHTTASDGLHSPSDNVRFAKEVGLSAIAITDHDTMAGVDEACSAGKNLGIIVIPGVELSTSIEGEEVHILGYGMDRHNEVWQKRLSHQQSVRERRNEQLLLRLKALNMSITIEQIQAIAAVQGKVGSKGIGRPHIAEALVQSGYAASMSDAFERWLGKGKPAYISLERVHPFEAIQWIHEAGGAAVVAHPGIYHNDKFVEDILAHGADGIEVDHPDHDRIDRTRYRAMAERYQKRSTAGSDFHGTRHGIVFHGAIGSESVALHTIEDWIK